jgi:Phage integrase family
VLCHSDGRPLTQSAIEAALRFGCKRAGLRSIGSHVLRHTFCSHLAMRGAAPKAIQELVGHSTLTMTLRYMHLAPSALTEAIDLLNFGQPVGSAPANDAVRPRICCNRSGFLRCSQPFGLLRSSGPYGGSDRDCSLLRVAWSFWADGANPLEPQLVERRDRQSGREGSNPSPIMRNRQVPERRLAVVCDYFCGEGGIRTLGTVSRTHDFQSCTFGHSVTSPCRGEPSGVAAGCPFARRPVEVEVRNGFLRRVGLCRRLPPSIRA